jgi:hypothetical protein
LAVWKVPRQCPLVLLLKDLINFGFKDVGAAVVGGMEANFGSEERVAYLPVI